LTLTLSGLSYAIVHELDAATGRELTGIKCLVCERTSWYDADVQNLYCANCNIFHRDHVPFGLRAPFIYKKPGLLERLWRVTDPLRQRVVRWCMKSKV
jgi:hypothetical protein